MGAGGHALSCIDVVEQENKYNIIGLIGFDNQLGDSIAGYKVIATEEALPELARECKFALNAVGQLRDVELRVNLFNKLIEAGFKLPTIISPMAYVSSHASVGEGSIVLHGAIVNSGAKVGMNCIINSRSLLEHGASVSDHSHISTGAILNGDTSVGFSTFVGSGSILKQGVSVGNDCFIPMGQIVTRNIEDYSTSAGADKL